ncbi:MAG: hypothetical protein J6R85_04530 [Lentisphaeria bacterium]|nr:hypothetical protein [Lentisphaeria bacterium]
MIKSSEHAISILEHDGTRTPFDPVGLRDLLIRCFLDAGQRENCYFAEDIALAVEYAFAHSTRPELTFGRPELDEAVVRILEDTGLAAVAELYRHGSPGTLRVECAVDRNTASAVLRKFLAGSEKRLNQLADKTVAALTQLEIANAAPSLMVELARHYEATAPLPAVSLPSPQSDPEYFQINTASILAGVSESTRELHSKGVLKVENISRLFPSIRLYCFGSRAADFFGWQPPVTELALLGDLLTLGKALEETRSAALQMYRSQTGMPQGELPAYLSLPDIGDFTVQYLGAEPGKSASLERELAQILTEPISVPLEKVTSGNGNLFSGK